MRRSRKLNHEPRITKILHRESFSFETIFYASIFSDFLDLVAPDPKAQRVRVVYTSAKMIKMKKRKTYEPFLFFHINIHLALPQ